MGYAMGERSSRNLVSRSLLRLRSPASVPQRESCIIQTGAASYCSQEYRSLLERFETANLHEQDRQLF